MSGERPAHVIAPDEVDGWLADSVVKVVTFHRTSALAARQIVEHGIDIGRSETGAFGQGFYTATESDSFHGEVEIAVAIKLCAPLVGSADDLETYVDRLTTRFDPRNPRLSAAVARRIRRELVSEGYDGIVVRDGGGDGIDYVIAIDASIVKVVRG